MRVRGSLDLEPRQERAAVVHLLHQGVCRVPKLRVEDSLAQPLGSRPHRGQGTSTALGSSQGLTLTLCVTWRKSLPFSEMNFSLSFVNFFDCLP